MLRQKSADQKDITLSDNEAHHMLLYSDIYSRIKDSGRGRWFTLSPLNDKGTSEAEYKYWTKKLVTLRDIADELILVVEMSQSLNLHYHAYYSRKNPHKEFRYKNGWSQEKAQVKIFDGEPERGLRYLFKSLDNTGMYFKNKDKKLVYNRDELTQLQKQYKKDSDDLITGISNFD